MEDERKAEASERWPSVLSPRLGLLALVAGLAGACSEMGTDPTAPDGPRLDPVVLGTIRCEVSAEGMRCGSEGSAPPDGVAASKTTTVGGQNTYVTLSSSITDGFGTGTAGLLAADVTVKNMLVQPMGTTNSDGSAPGGAQDIKVFFDEGPTVTEGIGLVTVKNPGGTGNFTGTNQPYYQYEKGTDYTGTLATDGTTSSKNWQFDHDADVTSFAFSVYVTMDLPHENSIYLSTDRSPGGGEVHGTWGFGSSGDSIWITDSDKKIKPSTDGGASWTEQHTASVILFGIWGSAGDSLWAVGESGKILASSDGGGSWSEQTSTVSLKLFDVSGVSSQELWAVGEGGKIVHTSDGGSSWAEQTNPFGGEAGKLFGVWMADGSNGWAVGEIGQVARYDGTSWTVDTTGVGDTKLRDVWGSSPTDVWAVGESGRLLHRDAGGWSVHSQAGTVTIDQLKAVHGSASSDVTVVGGSGVLIHYDGSAWMKMTSRTGDQLNDIFQFSATRAFAAGANGTGRSFGR